MSLGEFSSRLFRCGQYLNGPVSRQLLRRPCSLHGQRLRRVLLCTESSQSPDNEAPSSTSQHTVLKIQSEEYLQNVETFANKIGVEFKDINHLLVALTNETYLKDYMPVLGKHSYQHNGRLSLLGMFTARRLLTEYLLSTHPDLPPDQSWDIQNALLEMPNLVHYARNIWLPEMLLVTEPMPATAVPRGLLAVIGAIYIDQGSAVAWRFIQKYLFQEMTESRIKHLCQLQHPKFMIKKLASHIGTEPVKAKVISKTVGSPTIYTVGLYCGDELLARGKGLHPNEAERKACLVVLSKRLREPCAEGKLPRQYDDYEEEFQINLGLITSNQRIVQITKDEYEGFGFNVRGGEKKVGKNRKYLQYHYYSPIFICKLTPGGLAERTGGIDVGDLVLAVNDFSLVGLDHQNAVRILKSVSGDCTLTLKYSPEVIVEDEVEMKLKSVLRRKVEGELTQTGWAEWHMSLAQLYPEKYKDFL